MQPFFPFLALNGLSGMLLKHRRKIRFTTVLSIEEIVFASVHET